MPHQDDDARKAYHKAYNATPEQKAKAKAYRSRPDVRARVRAQAVARYEDPVVQAAAKARREDPDRKAKAKTKRLERTSTPEWKAKIREYQRARADRLRETRRLREYGISRAEQQALHQEHSKGCAICRAPWDEGPCCFDHDHATGEVRGLLCRTCNIILGLAKDSPSRLRAAAAYLDRKQPKLRLVK